MKPSEMSFQTLRILANHCDIERKGTLMDGDTISFRSKGTPFHKEVRAKGSVTINGHHFTLLKASAIVCRDDFIQWLKTNWSKWVNPDGTEKTNPEVAKSEEMPNETELLMWKDVRKMFQQSAPIAGWIKHGQEPSLCELKSLLLQYKAELDIDDKFNQRYLTTNFQYGMACACYEYLTGHYASCVNNLKKLAAACIIGARWVIETHSNNPRLGLNR